MLNGSGLALTFPQPGFGYCVSLLRDTGKYLWFPKQPFICKLPTLPYFLNPVTKLI